MARKPKQERLLDKPLTEDQDVTLRQVYRAGGGTDFNWNRARLHELEQRGLIGIATQRHETRWYVTLKGAVYCQKREGKEVDATLHDQLSEVVSKVHAAHYANRPNCEHDCPLCQVERAEKED